jgi:serine/threonine-protein kinase
MPEIDQTISHYRIIEKLGQGGMGEVFLAHDTSLDRKVALKFLPDVFSGDPERLARFEREAKLLASLNHPNIATIYGLEQADGKRFLAMELVEGETLAQQIERGPLPVDEALDVCRQIAEGVEAAHEKGVIHRDLKPANVKITPEGKVKVLDFGLAKAFQGQTAAADASHSPTLTDHMTRAGVILGTAAYMAPEQAKGRAVDKRADIWAFGCILYECLTGNRPFRGDTLTETLASILKGEPEWGALPADTPESISTLLRRCLQKDPSLRLRDIGDARIEIGESPTSRSASSPVSRRFSLWWLVPCVVVALLAGIFVGRMLTKSSRPLPSAPMVISTIKVAPGHWLDGMRHADFSLQRPSRTAMAISSDSSFIIYSAIEENPGPQAKSQLFLHRMDQDEAKVIPGTEGGISPFLSPDNRWVGFWADKKLKKVPVEGGVPRELCDIRQSLLGANWGNNHSIVFADGERSGLRLISDDGGRPETLTKPDPKLLELGHRLPFWLPDEKAVLFTVMKQRWDRRPKVYLFRMDTHKWHKVLEDAADARYIPGQLVFLRQGKLMAVRFDLSTLTVIGEPEPFKENVMQAFSDHAGLHSSAGQFAVSDTGTLVYVPGGIVPDENRSLVWVDRRGNELPVKGLQGHLSQPRISPDDKRIAYLTQGSTGRIWVYDLESGRPSGITDEGRPFGLVWTRDSKKLVFGWHESIEPNLFWQPYSESSAMVRLTTIDNIQLPGSWWTDEKTLAFVEVDQDSNCDIALLDTPTGQVSKFLYSKFDEKYPEFSPDGRFIAYTWDRTDRMEVYVKSYPSLDNAYRRVSIDGGIEPVWSRDSKQLFYRWPEELPTQMWFVDIPADGRPPSKPVLLFDKPGCYFCEPIRGYDLSLDSQRFLMAKYEQRKPTPVTEMILVQNVKELKNASSAGKK